MPFVWQRRKRQALLIGCFVKEFNKLQFTINMLIFVQRPPTVLHNQSGDFCKSTKLVLLFWS